MFELRSLCARGAPSSLAARQSATAGRTSYWTIKRRRRVLGDVARVGDHHRDRFAHISHFIARERMLSARHRDRRIGQQHRQRLAAHRLRQVVRGEHRVDAGYDQRRPGVAAAKLGVSVGRAHETGVQHPGQLHVVDESPAAGNERRVFEPRHARAEMLRAHYCVPAFPAAPRRRCAASSAAATMPA